MTMLCYFLQELCYKVMQDNLWQALITEKLQHQRYFMFYVDIDIHLYISLVFTIFKIHGYCIWNTG